MGVYLRDTLRLPAKGRCPSALPLLHEWVSEGTVVAGVGAWAPRYYLTGPPSGDLGLPLFRKWP